MGAGHQDSGPRNKTPAWMLNCGAINKTVEV